MGVIAPLSGSHSLLELSPSDFCLNGENYGCGWKLGVVGRVGERKPHSQSHCGSDKGPEVLPFPAWKKAGRKLEVTDVLLMSGTGLGDFSFNT